MKQTQIKVPPPLPKIRSLHETVLGILKKYGPEKQGVLARQLDASDGHLSEVMKGAGGKHWPAAWLDYIADHYDFEAELAQHFADKRGLAVRPPRQRSIAERWRRISFVLGRHGAVGKAFLDEADALPEEAFADEEEAT